VVVHFLHNTDEIYLQDLSTFRGRTIQIEVGPVGRYAYGDDGKDGFSVWAAGKSGWFLLEPAPQCQQIFDLMYNDIRAWYFVLESVESKSSQNDPLLSFAAENGLPMETAQETFRRASRFILNNMTLNREGVNWQTQPIRKFMRSFEPQLQDAPVSLQWYPKVLANLLLERWKGSKTPWSHPRCYIEQGGLQGRGFLRCSQARQGTRQTKAGSGNTMEIYATDLRATENTYTERFGAEGLF
jgi:hypothetical protein